MIPKRMQRGLRVITLHGEKSALEKLELLDGIIIISYFGSRNIFFRRLYVILHIKIQFSLKRLKKTYIFFKNI